MDNNMNFEDNEEQKNINNEVIDNENVINKAINSTMDTVFGENDDNVYENTIKEEKI